MKSRLFRSLFFKADLIPNAPRGTTHGNPSHVDFVLSRFLGKTKHDYTLPTTLKMTEFRVTFKTYFHEIFYRITNEGLRVSTKMKERIVSHGVLLCLMNFCGLLLYYHG